MKTATHNATRKGRTIVSPFTPTAPLTAAQTETRASATFACVTRTLPRASPSTTINGIHRITSLVAVSIARAHANKHRREAGHRLRRAAASTPFPRSDIRNRATMHAAGAVASMLLAMTGTVIERRLAFFCSIVMRTRS